MNLLKALLILSCLIFTSGAQATLSSEETKSPVVPLIYKVRNTKLDVTFTLLGTVHTFPYKYLEKSVRSDIEKNTMLAVEHLEEASLELPQAKESDKPLFNKLFKSSWYKSLKDTNPWKKAFLEAYDEKQCFVACCIAELLTQKYPQGMDCSIEEIFEKKPSKIVGLVDSKSVKEAMRGPLTATYKDLFDEKGQCILTTDDFCNNYPQTLEEVKKDRRQGSSILKSLDERDLPFAINSLKFAQKNKKNKLLVAVGCNHLPFMLNHYKKQGWTVTQLFTKLQTSSSEKMENKKPTTLSPPPI